jgi:RecB family exonuclease
MTGFLTALLVVTGLGLIGWLIVSLGRARHVKNENLPEELKGSRLWASEQDFSCWRPVRLTGRVDKVYKRPDGEFVLVETKRRKYARVYESDRLQLSIYRTLLRHGVRDGWLRRPTVAMRGYVRVVKRDGDVSYMPVQLLDDVDVVQAHHRYWDLLAEREKPRSAQNAGLCKKCSSQARCPYIQRMAKAS